MRLMRPAYFIVLLLIFVVGACSPRLAAPIAAPSLPADTPIPASTEVAAPAPADATTAPVAAALSMEVGSFYSYFDGSVLVAVPAGQFTMGSGGPDNPIRVIDLADFWIYQVEVTNRMYALCVDLGACSPPDAEDNPLFAQITEANKPVVGVNWDQASSYCQFANGRLPTEAEWEKAARGPDGNMYPWGNEGPTCNLLNFDACVHKTTFVGTYPAGESYYKALDLAGNVFEWGWDWYKNDYYVSAPTQAPQGPASGNERSIRSSAFNSDGFLTEVARRFHAQPSDHRADLGFRCVVDDPTAFAPFCTQLLRYGKAPPIGQGTGEKLKVFCNEPKVVPALIDCKHTNIMIDTGDGPLTITDVDPTYCHPTGTPLQWWCEPGAGWIKVCGDCTISKPSEVSCPPGYHQDGKLCVIDQGRPGRCPTGSLYDEAQMCCSPQTAKGYSYLICASWASFYQGPNENDPSYCFIGDFPGRQCWYGPVEFKQGCQDGSKPDCETDPTAEGCGGPPCTGPNCPPPDGSQPCTGPNCPTGCVPTTNKPCTNPCLAANTLIDTPSGQIAVQDLRTGDAVWSANGDGQRVRALVLSTSVVPQPPSHQVIHIVLADNRELWASPDHPTADGRTLGGLVAGDHLDGSAILLAERLDYDQPATYDLLPSGATGYYWADGILLGSTLLNP